MNKLSKLLLEKISISLPEVIRNGDTIHTYPGCLNLSFAFVEGESLLMALKDIALSSGSACTSASLEPSYVLRAIGADEDLAHSSIRYSMIYLLINLKYNNKYSELLIKYRFGFGRFTTEDEVIYTAEKCIKHVQRLREMRFVFEIIYI